jgi:hypothetical protein
MSPWHRPVKIGELLPAVEKFGLTEIWVPACLTEHIRGLKAHGKTANRIS